jgi:hypothetical protein
MSTKFLQENSKLKCFANFKIVFYLLNKTLTNNTKPAATLTFKWPRSYLNFSAWFMKNMSIIWTEKDKIMN